MGVEWVNTHRSAHLESNSLVKFQIHGEIKSDGCKSLEEEVQHFSL